MALLLTYNYDSTGNVLVDKPQVGIPLKEAVFTPVFSDQTPKYQDGVRSKIVVPLFGGVPYVYYTQFTPSQLELMRDNELDAS